MNKTGKYIILLISIVIAIPVFSQPGNNSRGNRDTITVHPGWPIVRDGKNERGGIYCNLDQDDDLEIVWTIGNYVYAFNMNGTAVSGWPVELNYPTDGAAAFGDIDGDGSGEIVVTTHQPTSYNDGKIYAFEKNGNAVWGFPVTTEGGPLRSPVLADLDQNGTMEIIVAIRKWPEGFIHVYTGYGTMYPGWPQRMDYIPASAVAAGDITGDEYPEVITESYYSLHAYTGSGDLLPGFPFIPGNERVFSYSSPVLADINDDGLREIIVGDHSIATGDGKLYIIKNDGSFFDGWPKSTASGIYSPPAVGDINGDGALDVVTGEFGANFGAYKVYAWTCATGQPIPGFPIMGLNSVNNQVILADLDGDDEIELMFDDNTSAGVILGYNNDGTPMEDWPLHVNGTSFYMNPFVADLNGDNYMEICGGGYVPGEDKTYVYLWDTEVEMNQDLAVLPILQYNTRHNGVAGDFLMVGTDEPVIYLQHLNEEVSVYPNPASDHISVTFLKPVTEIKVIELYDLAGKLIRVFPQKNKTYPRTSLTLDINGILPGTYLMEIATTEKTLTQKIIIR